MRKALLLALAAGGLFTVATAFDAQALPTSPATLSTQSAQSSDVTTVADRCGPRRHFSRRFHRCVHN